MTHISISTITKPKNGKNMNKKIISVFICLLFMGMIPVVAGMNNYDKIETEADSDTDSNSTTTGYWIYYVCIDRDGYLIFAVKNYLEHDIYNISFDIEFVGGVPFFKADSETDVFVDHLPSGETIEVKSNDPIIKPKPIIGRPLFLGPYFLTIDEYRFGIFGLFTYLHIVAPI